MDKRQPDFFPWYRGVDAPPSPHWSTHKGYRSPLHHPCITKSKYPLRIPFLHLRNGGFQTVYNFFFLGLPQTPRAHQEPPITKTV